MINQIERFQGEYRWLSNFISAPLDIGGHLYATVEHAYQAAKTLDPYEKAEICRCHTPGAAKREGRRVMMRSDWDRIKKDVMLVLLRMKFSVEPYRSQLLGTGGAMLVEGNEWGDTYWGVYRGKGQNVLGQLLMQVRTELLDGAKGNE